MRNSEFALYRHGSSQTKASGEKEEFGGAEGIRTPDPHNAIVVLYQLSYDPKSKAPNSARKTPTLSKHYSGSTEKNRRKRIELATLAGILFRFRKY